MITGENTSCLKSWNRSLQQLALHKHKHGFPATFSNRVLHQNFFAERQLPQDRMELVLRINDLFLKDMKKNSRTKWSLFTATSERSQVTGEGQRMRQQSQPCPEELQNFLMRDRIRNKMADEIQCWLVQSNVHRKNKSKFTYPSCSKYLLFLSKAW